MTGATLKSAFVDFQIDFEVANGVYDAAIADSCIRHSNSRLPSATSSPRSVIEDLHADVRDAIEDAAKKPLLDNESSVARPQTGDRQRPGTP